MSENNWTEDQVFECAVEPEQGGDIPAIPANARIVVNRAMIGRRLRFSFACEFRRDDEDRGTRFFPAIAKGQGKIETCRFSVALMKAMSEAEAYVQSELQIYEDEQIEERQAREQNRMAVRTPGTVSRAPATVRVGKTERDKTKGKSAQTALPHILATA